MPFISLPASPLTSIRSPSMKLKIFRILNIITILASFSNVYFAVFSRPSSIDISNKHPTYFTSSIYFEIIFWTILYFLQLGFAFYAQFSNIRIVQDIVENVVSFLFSLSNLSLCGWLYFWMNENFILAEFFVLLILISTSITQYRLIVKYIPNHNLIPIYVISFIHIPFSMYSAYSWLALFHNGIIAFGFEKVEYAALGLACVMSIIGFTWYFAGVFSKGRRDFIFSATIAWSLLGICVQQRKTSLPVAITCGVLAFAQFIVILYIIIKNRSRLTSGNIGERRGLLFQSQHFYGEGSIANSRPVIVNVR